MHWTSLELVTVTVLSHFAEFVPSFWSQNKSSNCVSGLALRVPLTVCLELHFFALRAFFQNRS